jgi:predicted MPP superfamily phosphohydrolase
MIELLCAVDVVVLALGAVVAWRTSVRGAARELAFAIALVMVATFVLAALARTWGGFAMLRGACHGLFCVGLPLLAVRAVRIRRDTRWLAALLAVAFVTGEACYVWARRVEPFRLEVTTAKVTSPRLATLPAPVRVALVADLQCEQIGAYEVSVFDRLVDAKPDLVLWLGDYIQWTEDGHLEPHRTALHRQLARLSPRLGMFAVDGDVDGRCELVFDGTAVRVLRDRHVALPDVPIDVIGLSRTKSRAPFVGSELVGRLRGERFPIVIGHAPDFMLAVLRGGLRADALMCAGHTHGGQVQVPFFGPVVTLSSVPRWLAGGAIARRGDTWLVCSRGIGMEREHAPRIRFWCRPQLVVLDLAGEGA